MDEVEAPPFKAGVKKMAKKGNKAKLKHDKQICMLTV